MKHVEFDKENCPSNTSERDNQRQSDVESKSKLPSVTDFEFIKPISKGAFGKVFLGQKKNGPDKMYAIKVMKKADLVNKNLIKQATAERDALAVSSSPFIVQLYYSLQSQQNIFLIMEYLIGGDVKSLLAIYGYFDEDMAVMYAAEVALALEYLHGRGIIHRDLKPDNMLITDQGHIKLTDFGLSKVSLDKVEDMARPAVDPGNKYNIFRTPGQILSLRSSLAFNLPSARKAKKPALFVSPIAAGRKSTFNSPQPLVEKSPFCSPLRNINTTSPLLRFSLTPRRAMSERRVNNSTAERPPPPIQSLTPTLRDSLNWSSDTDAGGKMSKRRHSSQINGSASEASELTVSALFRANDSVFSTAEKKLADSEGLPDVSSCSHTSEGSCQSHLKAPSRQESFTDETPQLHRTDESVWNSYAARNLRSMREGSYSEESEMDGDARKMNSMSDADLSISCCDSSAESGRFTSLSNRGSSSYSYPSDDEGDNSQHSCRNRSRRRRSFEISDDSAFSRRSSVGVHMMGVIQEEKILPRSESFPNCLVEGSRGSSGWRDMDDEVSDISDCDISIGQKDERCRLTFQSTSSEDSVPPVASTGLTQDIKILSVREGNNLSGQSAQGCSQPDVRGKQTKPSVAHAAKTGLTQSIELLKVGSPRVRLAPRIASTGLTQEIRTLALSSTRKQSQTRHTERHEEHVICSIPEESADADPDAEEVSAVTNKLKKMRANSLSEPRSSGLTQDFTGLDLAEKVCKTKQDKITWKEESKSVSPKTQVDEVIKRSQSRKRSFDLIDGCTDDFKHASEVYERLYGDEHLRKRSNLESVSSEDLDDINVSCHDCSSTFSDVSSTELSPIVAAQKQTPHTGDMKSPPFSVVVSHTSPIPSPQDLPPSPPAPLPKLCMHRKKELSLSPVQGSAQRKHFFGEDFVFKSPMPQKTRFESSCTCQGRPGHLNSKSSLKDSPAFTPERVWHRKVSLKPAPFTPFTPFTPGNPAKTPFLTPFRAAAQRTPFRTPKSVRRGRPQPEEEQRILGTPDYLAPEILLQQAHGVAVDWWALGVCLFEFLTGIPPFNDQTPDSVFENILKRDIPWPDGDEALSENAQNAIDSLLTMDPDQRPEAKEVRKLPLFCNVDWDHVLEMEPTFVPQPDDETDTTYFDARNCLQNLIVSDVDF